MSTTSRPSHYGARFTSLLLSLGFLSAAVLYVVFVGRPGGTPGELFGDPFGQHRATAAPTADTAVQRSARTTPDVHPEPQRDTPAGGAAAAPSTPTTATGITEPRVATTSPQPADARENARGAASDRHWEEALGVYDRLVRERPTDRDLALERARVLSWSGAHAEAAHAFAAARPSAAEEPDLVLELVQNLFWAGLHLEADDALQPLARLRPADPQIDDFRTRIRRSVNPPLEVARVWLERRDTGLERLALARSLARLGRHAESLDHYRRAHRDRPPGDSLSLEVAAAAEAADSLGLAAAMLDGYLREVPDDHGTRLRLARNHAAAGSTEAARAEYQRVIAATGRTDARFELARLDAWDGRFDAARPVLETLLREEPGSGEVLALLGDLARWSGDLDAATSYYRRAVAADPSDVRLVAALSEVESAAAGTPHLRRSLAWAATVDTFGDTEGFRWVGSRASRSWHHGDFRLDLAVQQELWAAEVHGADLEPGPGYGVGLTSETPLSGSLRLRLGGGMRSYGSGFDFASWLLELEHRDLLGARVELGYRREPAFRRAATAAALEAQATADVIGTTASGSAGAWHLWSRLEMERLRSSLGETVRGSGAAALRRDLGDGWAAYTSAGALFSDGASPLLAGRGPLYWTPASFVSVAAGGAFQSSFSRHWSFQMRMAPGYAWIDERSGEAMRYTSGRTATVATGFETVYLRGSWRGTLGGEWNAAHRGYRASSLQFGVHYSPPRP